MDGAEPVAPSRFLECVISRAVVNYQNTAMQAFQNISQADVANVSPQSFTVGMNRLGEIITM